MGVGGWGGEEWRRAERGGEERRSVEQGGEERSKRMKVDLAGYCRGRVWAMERRRLEAMLREFAGVEVDGAVLERLRVQEPVGASV